MSVDNLHGQSAFLEIFLTTTLAQKKALLKTLVPEQVEVLLEILHNLFVLPHEKEDMEFYKKRKKFLSKFHKDISLPARRRHLIARKATVLRVLHHFRSKLLGLL